MSCAAAGTAGLRQGDWKFIAGTKPELYNLADDIGETKNLAAEQPERVVAMTALLKKIIADGRSTPGASQKNDVTVTIMHAKKGQQ